jgi:cytosine/uracil/thiamine/allantoin permease
MDCIDGLTENRCPWIIVKSAATLLSFLSAYAVFMGPMAGV